MKTHNLSITQPDNCAGISCDKYFWDRSIKMYHNVNIDKYYRILEYIDKACNSLCSIDICCRCLNSARAKSHHTCAINNNDGLLKEEDLREA